MIIMKWKYSSNDMKLKHSNDDENEWSQQQEQNWSIPAIIITLQHSSNHNYDAKTLL